MNDPVGLPEEAILAIGDEMHGWARDLFPICRSITGDGVRQTLRYFQNILPDLTLHEVPSGTRAFDWTVPDEWNITEGYLENEAGERIVDFADSNLHVLNYSEPVDCWLDRGALESHLYSMPDQPDLTPYVTSYYQRRWGFCLPHRLRESLPPGRYHAVIRSRLEPGALTYGELVLPGQVADEVLLSTDISHPSIANNELSGPVTTAALARWLSRRPDRRLTYRIVFLPETIGSILYLSRHLAALKQNVIAGYLVICTGDERTYSLMPSRDGNTLADRIARHVLQRRVEAYDEYDFLERGGDERQYCSPGIDLPLAVVMRSKYATYPEYHTSADDLSLVTPAGLAGSYMVLRDCLRILEHDGYYRATTLCEPQLGKRGLYPTLSVKGSATGVRAMMNVLAFCDGRRDLVALSERVRLSAPDVIPMLETLVAHDLIERLDTPFDGA